MSTEEEEIEDEEIKEEEIEEKEICDLNLFFGFIIVFSSIPFLISFFMVNINTQIIIFSINLLIIGVAFAGIGIPDKNQGVTAANVEIWWGVITTLVGLVCFFISLISSNLIIYILLTINVIFLIAGLAAIFAPAAERDTRTWSKWIMIVSAIIMFACSLIYIILLILKIYGFIIISFEDIVNFMNWGLFISIIFHGIARITMSKTGIYT